jgi:hemerythrin-like domain-containing protein
MHKIKELKLFECIAMSENHMNICKTLSLVYFKPYDVIYNQNDVGDSFFYILNGIVKQTIHKKLDNSIFTNTLNKRLSKNNLNNINNEIEKNEDGDQIIEVNFFIIYWIFIKK